MPSYELAPFTPCPAVRIVAATELVLPATINVLFLALDPEQRIDWTGASSVKNMTSGSPRQDGLWQHTCFEVFVGIKDQADYREVNLSPQASWNCYAFKNYRQPDVIPPNWADDIKLLNISCQGNKLQATLDLKPFIEQQDCYLEDLKLGLSAVLQLKDQQAFYALQHSGRQADFHDRRDWLIQL